MKSASGKSGSVLQPEAFVFCDRISGAMRFQVQAAPGGTLPVEQAASLLAMHCLVRKQAPHDYTVLVVPSGGLLDPVGRRAQELLNVGKAIGPEVRLTPREREVLDCVVRGLANKQIAYCLHVSERTVKFHVSALLAKFKVCDRMALIREAMTGLLPASAAPVDTLFGFPVPARALSTGPKEVRVAAGNTTVLRMGSSNQPVRTDTQDNTMARRPARSFRAGQRAVDNAFG